MVFNLFVCLLSWRWKSIVLSFWMEFLGFEEGFLMKFFLVARSGEFLSWIFPFLYRFSLDKRSKCVKSQQKGSKWDNLKIINPQIRKSTRKPFKLRANLKCSIPKCSVSNTKNTLETFKTSTQPKKPIRLEIFPSCKINTTTKISYKGPFSLSILQIQKNFSSAY